MHSANYKQGQGRSDSACAMIYPYIPHYIFPPRKLRKKGMEEEKGAKKKP